MLYKARNLIYIILAGFLSLLGFSSCRSSKSVTIENDKEKKIIPRDDPGRMRLMYGVPTRRYVQIEKRNEDIKEEEK